MPDEAGAKEKRKETLMERLFGAKDEDERREEAEEEILTLAEEGTEKGLIEDETKTVIENIFDFDDTRASEIMTHRRDMTTLELSDTLAIVKKTAIESGHSRIPVYQDDIDHIAGILYVKDLLRFVGEAEPRDFKLRAILRPAIFVPRTKDARSLFELMTKEKTQIVVVVDEYGGTEGVVTMEDLVEDILGNIQDEYDFEEEEIKKISDTAFTVDGSTSLEDIEQLTGITLEESGAETAAGFILERLGRIPEKDEHPCVESAGLKLKATKTDDRRILEVLIEKI